MSIDDINGTRNGPKPKKKRNIGLIVLISVIVVVLLAETGLVIATFVSPTASKTLTAQVEGIRELWTGENGKPGLPQRVLNGLDNFYRDNIVTLWSEPKPAEITATFAKCASCHTDYEIKVRFEHVYMNHSVHSQAGLSCVKCHPMVQHPNPDRPAESTCVKCHDQVNQKGQCGYCHPPGTLPHFYLMGAPRDQYIDCATCHPRSTIPQLGRTLVEVGQFGGDPDTLCLECHSAVAPQPSPSASATPWQLASPSPGPWPSDIPPWCQRCHGAKQPNPHASNWVKVHPQVALSDNGSCFNCHNQVWCAMKCHAVTSMGAPPLLPLPSPSPIGPSSPSPYLSPSPSLRPRPKPTPSEVRAP